MAQKARNQNRQDRENQSRAARRSSTARTSQGNQNRDNASRSPRSGQRSQAAQSSLAHGSDTSKSGQARPARRTPERASARTGTAGKRTAGGEDRSPSRSQIRPVSHTNLPEPLGAVAVHAQKILPASVPLPIAGLVILAWALLGLFWGTGVISSWAFTLFLATMVPAILGTGVIAAMVSRGKEPLRAARACVLLALLLVVPLVFDPHSTHVFNLPKYTVIVWGALVLGALWIVETMAKRRVVRWRNGMHWLLIASTVWVLITAIASVDPSMSVLGAPGSYDGLYSSLAFMVIAFSAAEAFDPRDLLKVMGVLGFAACSVASIYGLVQIHDLITHGPHWDFVHWARLPFHNVFSTMGNPNFLSGLYVIVLPACVLIVLRATKRWVRAVGAIACLILLAEILQSATRGAWVAAIAALFVLAIVLWPEIRRKPLLIAGGTGAVVIVVGTGLALGGAKYIGAKLTALFNAGPASSIQQRFDLWTAALHIGGLHPLLGTGPDTFEIVYPRYESAQWVHYLGQIFVANGAHDVWMNTLADKGWVGVAILVAILGYVGLRALGTLIRYRRAESSSFSTGGARAEGAGVGSAAGGMSTGTGGGGSTGKLGSGIGGATQRRYVFGVLAAGLVAYCVQDIFNVQEVALSMVFWMMLGLLCVAARDAGVPSTWSARRLLGIGVGRLDTVAIGNVGSLTFGNGDDNDALGSNGGGSRGRVSSRRGGLRAWMNTEVGGGARSRGGGGARSATNKGTQPRQAQRARQGHRNRNATTNPLPTLLTAIVAIVVVAILAFGADGPWRAAHDYWAALIAQKQYQGVAKTYGATSTQAKTIGNSYFTDLHNAMSLNPWDAGYPAAVGIDYGEAAVHASSGQARTADLAKAHTYMARAAAISPLESKYRDEYAQVLVDQAKVAQAGKAGAQARHDYAQAIAQLRKAIRYDPRDETFRAFLSQTVAAAKKL
ncbi:MAG: O-antigen ligase family protein [Actinobacteria bacterium]|nr:O-antigen ligase family protein [Actinomycetota bacterium]